MYFHILFSPMAHMQYSCLLETSGSIEAAEAVLELLVRWPDGCGALSLPAHLARAHFETRRGRLDASRRCLDNAQSVFERHALVTEMHAVLVKKVEFISTTHPIDINAAWQELMKYRRLESLYQCDDDLPLLRAAYGLLLRFPPKPMPTPDGDCFELDNMVRVLSISFT
jgi:hypothetical protein